eukprot:7256442-Ditylum_brightwellii.AAC.1
MRSGLNAHIQATQIQRTWRRNPRRRRPTNMATFVLNSYDGDIDLSNKEGRKLYDAGSTGVEKEHRFDRLKG